jgi:hypothetical protein
VLGGHDPVAAHRIASVAAVLMTLLIINMRAASIFIGILVRPVEAGLDGENRWGRRVAPAAEDRPGAAHVRLANASGAAARRWSIRIGPLEGRITTEAEAVADADSRSAADSPPGGPAPLGASARVGATIGVLERILIVVFVLTGTDVAIGFVVAAKTLARFRLLDDRAFAEYYLLGTLASVSVAIVTALVGRAALGVLLA